ncbi:LytR/AlgR family response regulator transcription factor [Maribacter halichondriae]|uniref:LytR/AlgR family response regulator transcription factor n=1 Tax=Maribacter halichondriae TaxID=2980554 RepID=UPI00235827C2|nr:LytTR family DNA-binding domain-containing protein [Maribacter sp. Hal144]
MIRAIIIDDEEDAREVLSLTLQKFCPEIEVIALCGSPEEGLDKINNLGPSLVFLDVQMPNMSGFDLLEKVTDINFDVIFVTAFNRYAIKAIRFSALDYLLKPIEVDDLVSAVERVKEKQKSNSVHYRSLLNNIKYGNEKLTRLAIPSDNEIVVQKLDDIVYCEADGSYTILHLVNNKKIMVSKILKEFEMMLPESDFCRIHHSTIVNIDHVIKYIKGEGGYVMVTGGGHLDVSRRKKEGFIKLLHKI